MRRRILLSYLLMTVLVLVILAVPLGLNFASRERERLLTAVERDARVLAQELDDSFENNSFDGVAPVVEDFVQQTGGRVVIVKADGRSVIDSDNPGITGRDFTSRPEIKAALAGRYASGQRQSKTLDTGLSYVAVPILSAGNVVGVVRVTYPTTDVDRRVRSVWRQLAALGGVVLAVASFAGWIVASTLSRPIDRLETTVDLLADGNLAARVPLDRGPDDLVRVGRTFNTMADRLQSLIESQQAFLADASHQLRTPLTAVRLRLENLADAAGHPDVPVETITDDVTAIGNEVDRLAELVDALLALARIDARPSATVPVDVVDIATERVAMWAPLAEERGITVELNVVGGSQHVLAESIDGGLQQILDNLVSNALDVSDDGATIQITVARDRDEVIISVSDEGPGMSDAQIGRAFDRFWRGPNPSEGGSGLGLAIVRRLAEVSGGSATIENLIPKGLRVSVTLAAARRVSRTAEVRSPGQP